MGRLFFEIPCTVCRRPVDLNTDLCADENGKAVHEECYVKRVTSALLARAWAERFCFQETQRTNKYSRQLSS